MEVFFRILINVREILSDHGCVQISDFVVVSIDYSRAVLRLQIDLSNFVAHVTPMDFDCRPISVLKSISTLWFYFLNR